MLQEKLENFFRLFHGIFDNFHLFQNYSIFYVFISPFLPDLLMTCC